MKIIRDLLVALLNATLLLAIVLVVCSIILVERMSNLRDETIQVVAQAILPQRERLDRVAEGIDAIEARLSENGNIDTPTLRAAFTDARENLPPLSDIECVARQTMVKRLVGEIGKSLTEAASR